MALTNCPDCSAEVSDRAPTCPRCGAPIAGRAEAVAVGAPLTTVQETSKHLKMHIIGAALCFWGGLGLIFFNARNPDDSPWMPMVLTLVVAFGFFWWIVTRV